MKRAKPIGVLALAAVLLVGCARSQSVPSSAASSAPQLAQSKGSSAAEVASSTAGTMQEIQPNLNSYSVLFLEDKDQEPGSSYFQVVLTREEKEALAALLPADQWQLVEPPEVGLSNYFALGQDNASQELRVDRLDDHTALIYNMQQTDRALMCWAVPAEQQALEEFSEKLIQRANQKSQG